MLMKSHFINYHTYAMRKLLSKASLHNNVAAHLNNDWRFVVGRVRLVNMSCLL